VAREGHRPPGSNDNRHVRDSNILRHVFEAVGTLRYPYEVRKAGYSPISAVGNGMNDCPSRNSELSKFITTRV
jgi:hypothetical protein